MYCSLAADGEMLFAMTRARDRSENLGDVVAGGDRVEVKKPTHGRPWAFSLPLP